MSKNWKKQHNQDYCIAVSDIFRPNNRKNNASSILFRAIYYCDVKGSFNKKKAILLDKYSVVYFLM